MRAGDQPVPLTPDMIWALEAGSQTRGSLTKAPFPEGVAYAFAVDTSGSMDSMTAAGRPRLRPCRRPSPNDHYPVPLFV